MSGRIPPHRHGEDLAGASADRKQLLNRAERGERDRIILLTSDDVRVPISRKALIRERSALSVVPLCWLS
jgi:hypothetical protein